MEGRRGSTEPLWRSKMPSAAAGEKICATGTGVFAALEFLALRADEQWPFEQFRGALANAGMDTTKLESTLANAQSLNAIKRVVRR